MYQLDTNLNTAIQRQADQVQAVRAYGSHYAIEQAGPSWTRLALAVAVPVGLIVVVGLMLH